MNFRRSYSLVLLGAVLVMTDCTTDDVPSMPNAARALTVASREEVTTLRARLHLAAPNDANTFALDAAGHVRVTARERARRSARVSLPANADGAIELADESSGMAITFSLDRAAHARIELADGLALYRSVFDGADLVHRVGAEGTEDFVLFDKKPASEQIHYTVDLSRVAGLRLVGNTLEFLSPNGAPQLRVAPPYVIDRSGGRRPARLSVEGCAYDTSPAAPWDRAVTHPGAARCTVAVAWRGVDYPAVVDPAWGATGSPNAKRAHHTTTVLSSGKLLVAGGFDGTLTLLASAELYDPAGAGTFAATGSMTLARQQHTATLLSSGKVLVVGGTNSDRSVAYQDAELYDPALGTFVTTDSLSLEARYAHTATALPSGKVLVAGGFAAVSVAVASAELFDPNGAGGAGAFTPTVSMATARAQHTATLLGSGKVLIAGGFSTDAMKSIAATELFDAVANAGAGAFTGTGAMLTARDTHTATLLPSGKVLVAMGSGNNYLASAEIFDPAVGSFSATGSGITPRLGQTATLLPSGKVLVAGGLTNGNLRLASTELFDPAVGTFAAGTPLMVPRVSHTATLLLGGKVVAIGGDTASLNTPSADVYAGTPGERCSTGASCISGFCADGFCCNTACDAGGCDRCDLPGTEGSCTIAPSGDPGASPACASPLACDGATAICPTSCATDAACAPTHYCAPDGICRPRKPQASACNTETDCKAPGCRECASGFCVDGFCCDQACSGICSACAAGLTQGMLPDGTCGPTKGGVDPRNECSAASETCGPDGQCNGTGACRIAAPAGLVCADGKVCDGAGACSDPPLSTCDGDHTATGANGKAQDCSPYTCGDDGTCRVSCASIEECIAPNVCDPTGNCVSSGDDGSGGGCSTAGRNADPSWLVSLAALWLVRRRKRTGDRQSDSGAAR